MDDKNLMQNLLLLEKGCCDLYMHGAVESGTQNVHLAFNSAFADSLSMQNEIYTKMADKGWYSPKPVEQKKIDSVKQQFSAMSC
jgi:spore coat protein CotF